MSLGVLASAALVALGAAGAGAAPGMRGVRLIFHGPKRAELALTFDDDFCGRCVHSLLRTLAGSGAHATFCPNGISARAGWAPADRRLARRLAARGEIAFCNHTWSHFDVRRLSDAQLAEELERNERWIERTFGVRAKPYFRPPYGAYDARTLALAGALGYSRVVLWSGTLADSSPRSIPYLLAAIRSWARPGAIILAHGDFPNTGRALPAILAILHRRGLRPVTLPELLGR